MSKENKKYTIETNFSSFKIIGPEKEKYVLSKRDVEKNFAKEGCDGNGCLTHIEGIGMLEDNIIFSFDHYHSSGLAGPAGSLYGKIINLSTGQVVMDTEKEYGIGVGSFSLVQHKDKIYHLAKESGYRGVRPSGVIASENLVYCLDIITYNSTGFNIKHDERSREEATPTGPWDIWANQSHTKRFFGKAKERIQEKFPRANIYEEIGYEDKWTTDIDSVLAKKIISMYDLERTK